MPEEPRQVGADSPIRKVRVIRAAPAADISPGPLTVLDRSSQTIETAEELREALARHDGPKDVPADTKAAERYLRRQLRSGRRLVQVTFTVPDEEAERAGTPSLAEPEGTPLLLGATHLAGLLGVTWRRVYHAFDHGLVDLVRSRASGNSAGVRAQTFKYAIVNERMAAWARRHERFVALQDIDLPSWLDEDEVRQAADDGAFYYRYEYEGRRRRFDVYVDYAWLEWVASWRPLRELRRILEHQVTNETADE